MSERDELVEHLRRLSTTELADGLMALEDNHAAQLAELNEDNDALWDKVQEQNDKILAVQVIHDSGYTGKCRTCNKQRHPGPCETSIALGVTE
jgi:phage host-nuclease inhibitor protein Gam